MNEADVSYKRLPIWVFSFALFPLGLGGFFLGALDIAAGYRSLTWPAAAGVVLSSRLEPSVLAPAQPAIRYQYLVGERPYVSNRIWSGRTLAHMPVMSQRASAELVAHFQEGAPVSVRVNPQDPLDVALIPGARKATVWMIVFTFFLSVGFWSPLALGRLFEKRRGGVV